MKGSNLSEWVYVELKMVLIPAFFLALGALILQGIAIPRLPILPFAPFLALTILRTGPAKTLWLSAFAGAVADLASDDPIGLHALNYTLSAFLLSRSRRYFLEESPSHLALLTGLISFLSTGFQWILLFLFDRRVPFDGRWIFADLIGMPAIDAFYSFVWFAAPLLLLGKLKKKWVLFWLKKKALSRISP